MRDQNELSKFQEKVAELAKHVDTTGERVQIFLDAEQQGELVRLYLAEDKERALDVCGNVARSHKLVEHIANDEMYAFACGFFDAVNEAVIGDVCERITNTASINFLDNVVKH